MVLLIDVMKRVFERVSLKSLGESTFFPPTGEREKRDTKNSSFGFDDDLQKTLITTSTINEIFDDDKSQT